LGQQKISPKALLSVFAASGPFCRLRFDIPHKICDGTESIFQLHVFRLPTIAGRRMLDQEPPLAMLPAKV